jgi:uncharacterized protein YndB with AHSA1/START domain
VGGQIRIDIDDQGFELTVTGEYRRLDRPRRLSFTWFCSTWDPEDGDSLVTVDLEPQGDGNTLMTIRHVRLPPSAVEGHRGGWTLIADQLATRLDSCFS